MPIKIVRPFGSYRDSDKGFKLPSFCVGTGVKILFIIMQRGGSKTYTYQYSGNVLRNQYPGIGISWELIISILITMCNLCVKNIKRFTSILRSFF